MKKLINAPRPASSLSSDLTTLGVETLSLRSSHIFSVILNAVKDLQMWVSNERLVKFLRFAQNDKKGAHSSSYVPRNGATMAVLAALLLSTPTSAQVYLNDAEFYIAPGAEVQLNMDLAVETNTTVHPWIYLNDSLFVTGDVDFDNGTIITGDGWIVLNGSDTQHVDFANADIQKLKLDNPLGASLNNETQIDDSLYFIQGVININGHNLTLGTYSSDSGVILGASPTGYVQTSDAGELRRYVDGNTFFPIGNGSYNPVLVSLANIDSVGVRVEDAVYEYYFPDSNVQTSDAVNRAWYISKDTGSSNSMDITAYWQTADELSLFANTNSFLNYYDRSANDWPAADTFTAAANSGGFYSQSRIGISVFNTYFGIGSENSPVPVELLSFLAHWQVVGKEALLTWSTASEYNNSHFEIERSTDLQQWETLGTQPGQGTTNKVTHYNFLDDQFKILNSKFKIVYYRLKQVDFNGKYEYSPIRTLEWNEGKRYLINIYPNPAESQLYIQPLQQNEVYQAELLDGAGRVVLQKEIASTTAVNLAPLAAGVYYLKLQSPSGDVQVEKVVVTR